MTSPTPVSPTRSRPYCADPRFLVGEAAAEWAVWPGLGELAEREGFTTVQAQVLLTLARGGCPKTFAKRHGKDSRWAERAFGFVTRRLQSRLKVEVRCRIYWREILSCFSNRKQKKGEAAVNVGLLPWVDTENHRTWEEYLETLRTPENYRTVSLRGPLVSAEDLCPRGERLAALVFG